MYYQLHTDSEKKVPGVVVLLGLLFLIGSLIFFFGNNKPKPIITQDSSVLERVDIANVRDKSITVYWRTSEPTQGYLVYGVQPDAIGTSVYDIRDKTSDLQERHNHIASITNINSDSDVYFRVVVDGEHVGQSSELPFIAHSGLPIKKAIDIAPIYGSVERLSGSQEKGAIVVLHIGNSKPLLTRTNNDGTFLFSPCCIYNNQSGDIMYPGVDDKVRLEIIAEDGTSKILQAALNDISPLADAVILDQPDTKIAQHIQNDEVPEVLAASDSLIKFDPIDIIYPRKGAAIPGVRPLIKGVGEPGTQVKGKLEPTNRIFRVQVDANRNWTYIPTFDFKPGLHQLKIETADEKGKLITLTRSFTILKSGEAVLASATPSGTITPTETPEKESTPSPTAVVTTTITPTPSPPVTGINIVPFSVISLVLIGIGAGIVLLF